MSCVNDMHTLMYHVYYQTIAGDINNHRTQYGDVTGLINDYITEFGSDIHIEDKKDNLIKKWNQLQENLTKTQKDYKKKVFKLKTINGNIVDYDAWMKEENIKKVDLPTMTCGLGCQLCLH